MSTRWLAAAAAIVVLGACQGEGAPPPAETGPEPGTPEYKIQLARSAAPAQVAEGATILEMSADTGVAPVQLVAGTTGWTCIVDLPDTPGPDPICADSVFMDWVDAWTNRRTPRTRSMGVAYMLQGGQAASDTDPYKAAPDPGQAWHLDPPHVMVVMPNPRQAFAGLPTTRTDASPWVMWAGTPYAHIMMPATAPARP